MDELWLQEHQEIEDEKRLELQKLRRRANLTPQESTTIRHTQEAWERAKKPHVPPTKYVYRKMTWSPYVDRMTLDSEVYKLSNWVEVANICRVRGYDYKEIKASMEEGAVNVLGSFTYVYREPNHWQITSSRQGRPTL